MEGILELQRRTHEVVDHLEEAIVQAMLQQAKTHKGRLMQEHFVSSLLDQININAERLEATYADDSLRSAELETITISTGPSDTGSFYEQLKGIKERHRRLGTTIEDLVETEAIMGSARLTDESLSRMFSGEESLGRYLDLQEPYEMYINLKDVRRTEYLRYLHEVTNFGAVPVSTKSGAPYKAYMCTLKSYLEGFFARTRPLLNLAALCQELAAEFEVLWESASVPGWEELSSKESDDMYCGACEKQFYNESVFKAHFSGKKHQKAAATAGTGNPRTATTRTEGKWAKEMAMMEHLVVKYLEFFETDLEETKNNVEAKQSRSSAERALDLEREEEALEKANEPAKEEADDKEDSDDPKIYNPLNLPLDWDGKPIPYWLWKLHGLGTRYPCEICGNQVYMGRKAFDQHFYEWRHSHGLRCLGIPNTRHFFQVTSIQDAMGLWVKLKKDAKQANFRPDVMEELEDQHGNVYSRKTYEDLSRQGII